MDHQETAPASRNQERVVAEFRANGGKVGGYHDGMPLLLLTTTGAKTGRRRATPLTYLPDGARYVVAAAAGGTPGDPAWYRNLVAHPDVTVEVGTVVFAARPLQVGDQAISQGLMSWTLVCSKSSM